MTPPPYRIHRYPTHLIERWTLRTGQRAILRPVLPQDQRPVQDFIAALSPAARRDRFHGAIVGLSDKRAAAMTCIDYLHDMAFVVTVLDGTGEAAHEIVIADGRYTLADGGEHVDFTVVVADAWQGLGLGRRLVSALCRSAQGVGAQCLRGEVLASNAAMLSLLQRCGFRIGPHPAEPGLVGVACDVATHAATEADNDSLFGALAQTLPRWWRQRG